ncbi:MAG TPA: preprotein translocase subunit YajC [Spirochaetota bacterium]
MNIFATAAYAQSATPGSSSGGGGFVLIIMMVVTFGIFYVLTVLPQKKRDKAHKQMIENLQKNDKVLTIGGIYGVITSVDSEKGTYTIKIADNTKVEVVKTAIQTKL